MTPSLRREHRLRDMLTPWSGTCSSNGALLTEKTPGDARSESCYPSCSKGWSEGCLPPPSRSTWPRLLPTTTLWKGSRWGSMTGSSDSLGGLEGWILHAPPSIPSWDLSLVLRALQQGPFEPLQTAEPKFLSMKTLLLLALASIKRVGDLHAFSVDDSCLQFGPADFQIILRPRPGYVPKVPTTPFRDQVVSLQALPPEEADPALALLCPVRALRHYVDRTQSFRTSDQLLSVTEAGRKGCRLQAEDGPLDSGCHHPGLSGTGCALPVQVESSLYEKCSVLLGAGSWRLTDRYCRAAGWATPNTFARFYSLRVEPVSSCVLTSNG